MHQGGLPALCVQVRTADATHPLSQRAARVLSIGGLDYSICGFLLCGLRVCLCLRSRCRADRNLAGMGGRCACVWGEPPSHCICPCNAHKLFFFFFQRLRLVRRCHDNPFSPSMIPRDRFVFVGGSSKTDRGCCQSPTPLLKHPGGGFVISQHFKTYDIKPV